jgi:16S rRNA U516 pseudouridylate synthase RsuA-like enzyme
MVTGVSTPDGRMIANSARRISARRARIVLSHGAKRQIRVMLETLGFRVTKLVRTRIGSLADPSLQPGKWRALEAGEIASLLTNPQILRKDSQRRR